MRLYETTFITSSQLEDSELDKEIKTVEDIIKSNGGNLVKTQRWGVRRFAYEIKKQKQGNYTHFLYEAGPEVPAALATTFKVNERVMRYLTVKSIVDLEKLNAEEQEEAAATTATPTPITPPAAKPEPAPAPEARVEPEATAETEPEAEKPEAEATSEEEKKD